MVGVSLDSLLTQDVTVLAPAAGPLDRYNNPTRDWENAAETTHKGRLEQTASTEVTLGRDTVVSDWLLFLPPEAVITPYDRVVVDGRTGEFEVVGLPDIEHTPRGPHHLEVRLAAVTG